MTTLDITYIIDKYGHHTDQIKGITEKNKDITNIGKSLILNLQMILEDAKLSQN